MAIKKCIICHSSNCRFFPNRFFKNNLTRCQECGLIFVNSQPNPSEIKKIYNKEYFKNNSLNSIGYQNYYKDKPNIIKTFERRFKKIKELHPQKGEILDLGCAMGFFLEVAENHGWDPYGVEISNYAANIAKKHFGNKIFNGTLDQAPFPSNFFDLITMWDYLEHLPKPAQEISLAYQLLKKNGLLILSTPDAGSIPHKIFRDRWLGYKDQEHLFYFSEKNLKMLLEKKGFKILGSHKIGKYVTLNLFIERLSHYNKFLANILKFLAVRINLLNLSFYINPQDIICLYAKKLN